MGIAVHCDILQVATVAGTVKSSPRPELPTVGVAMPIGTNQEQEPELLLNSARSSTGNSPTTEMSLMPCPQPPIEVAATPTETDPLDQFLSDQINGWIMDLAANVADTAGASLANYEQLSTYDISNGNEEIQEQIVVSGERMVAKVIRTRVSRQFLCDQINEFVSHAANVADTAGASPVTVDNYETNDISNENEEFQEHFVVSREKMVHKIIWSDHTYTTIIYI